MSEPTPRPTPLTLPDGRRLDVWSAGPTGGPSLVYHFGTPSSGLPSPAMIEATSARGLRLVTWSRPGYGGSTRKPRRIVADVVPDTAAVMDALGIERAYVAGWSGGGPHALACAALLPDRVLATATLAGVAPYPAEGLDYLAGMGAENVEEFNAALDGADALLVFKERAWPIFRDLKPADVGSAMGDLVDEVDRATAADPAFGRFLAANMRVALRDSYWGWFDDDMAFVHPWGFDVGSVGGRVHVWQGAHDRMVPYGHGEWLAAHIRTAVPHLFPEHGHLSLVVDSFPRILDELLATAA